MEMPEHILIQQWRRGQYVLWAATRFDGHVSAEVKGAVLRRRKVSKPRALERADRMATYVPSLPSRKGWGRLVILLEWSRGKGGYDFSLFRMNPGRRFMRMEPEPVKLVTVFHAGTMDIMTSMKEKKPCH